MSQQQPKPLKIFVNAGDGIGHLNACVGMAQALASRGHQIYFLLNEGFKGQFTKYGFDEILLKTHQQPNADTTETNKDYQKPKNVVKEVTQMMIDMGFLSGMSPLEKMRAQIKNKDDAFMESCYRDLVQFDAQIEQAFEREQPDLFMMDNFLLPPALQKASGRIPWIAIISMAPLCVFESDKLPPFGSGYPTDSDPRTWQEYQLVIAEYVRNNGQYQVKLNEACNFKNPELEKKVPIFPKSKYLNIYGYPQELDYHDVISIPDNYARVDAFIRLEPEPFEVPKELGVQPGDKLIYVSLGTMGSMDVDLMKRILSVLKKTPHKYIVSKGQRADEYELPGNCWGEPMVPQTKVLPLVDLVMTHGGNNTTSETFSFGKPMIVMPLFGDQYDNAQRVQEMGYGLRLEPYHFTEDELTGAINKLLKDTMLHQRLKSASERMNSSNSKAMVCKRIEELVSKFQLENL